jgi:hypothetical protein
MLPTKDQDHGPFRIDLVLAIWTRVARTADALYQTQALSSSAAALHQRIQVTAEQGNQAIDDPELTRVLRVLAAQDGMHAGDWLRKTAVEAQMPRRKPPASIDLQVRLKGVQCVRLVCSLVRRRGDEDKMLESHRVTIRNTRGDVASCESDSFANALDGAIKMAGVRTEEP